MEELQDAIEDAQYVNAIASVEDGPRPVLPWPVPEEGEFSAWKAKVLAQSQAAEKKEKSDEKQMEKKEKEEQNDALTPFEFEWTLSHALGFFLFAAYLKEEAKEHVEINFMEMVLQWKDSTGRFRAKRTSALVTDYLSPLPEAARLAMEASLTESTAKPTSVTETDGGDSNSNNEGPASRTECVGEPAPRKASACPATAFGPPIIEINQYNLARKPIVCNYTKEGLRDISACRDPTKNYVGVGGHILVDIQKKVAKLQRAPGYSSLRNINEENSERGLAADDPDRLLVEALALKPPPLPPKREHVKESSLRTMSLISNDLPGNLFDQAEVLVAEHVRERHWAGFRASTYHDRLLRFLWFQDRTVIEEDFFVMRVLGRGGFGLVTACKKGTSGKLYAMKVQNKKRIKIKKAEQLTLNEKNCLADVNSPFVVNLKYSFQSPMDVFLILDLMTGGDLSFHLSQRGRFRPAECLYYAARIMLGLQALHDRGYVYRDLKPENCLLGEDGRVKLTDLGLAVQVSKSLRGAAGTRGYWAPEMLRRDEHGKRKTYNQMVDWFSFGCCLAEFISGENPFRTEAALKFGLDKDKDKDTKDNKKSKVSFSPQKRMQDKRRQQEKAIDIATLQMQPKFEHKVFEEDSTDLCRRLLDKHEHTRLGVTGASEIMTHPYFRRVDWEEIMSDRMTPPFVPRKDVNAASQSEIGTFPEDKAFHQTVLDEKDEAVYKSWNFTNTQAFAAEVIEFLIYERETGKPLLPIQHSDSCCCNII